MILLPQPTLTPSVYKLTKSVCGRLVGTLRVNAAEPTSQGALYTRSKAIDMARGEISGTNSRR